ncbi:MAG TPA: Ig-like domain-containing protein [Gemmatimonadales bacterium]|nr:Ig-like domain-containing protein [Gemmatimonadales bacterium]
MKRSCALLMAAVAAAACHSSTGPSPAVAITVSPPGLTILTGDTITLAAAAVTAAGDPAPSSMFTWTSLDSTRVTVSAAGLVRGIRPGATLVQVSGGGLETDVPVAILVPVDSVLISPDTITNHVGDTGELAILYYDSTGTQLSARLTQWASTDTTVVRLNVDAGGPAGAGLEYHAVAPGTALIIATCEGKSDTATVTVVP